MCHFGLGCTPEIQGLAKLSRLCCDITAWRRLLVLKDKHMANSISAPGVCGGVALNTGYNIKDCFKVIQYSNAGIQLISVIV